MKVTVRSTTGQKNAPRVIRGNDRVFGTIRTWRVLADGKATDLSVADSRWGRTIINGQGRMVTGWHIGLPAGDLARSQAKRIGLTS